MRAIFSFKILTDPKILEETFFYNYADLAVRSARRYHSVHLYTDAGGKELFNSYGIEFDSVVVLPEIERYGGSLICMPKIFAMLHQKTPYVHLDFDTFTNHPYSSQELIGFGYPEVNLKLPVLTSNAILYVYDQYIQHSETFFKGKFPIDFEKSWEWSFIPNFSAIIVNKPTIVHYIYREILKHVKDLAYDELTPSYLATFIEQFLFVQYLNKLGIKHSYDYESAPSVFSERGSLRIGTNEYFFDDVYTLTVMIQSLKHNHFAGYRHNPGFSGVIDTLRQSI